MSHWPLEMLYTCGILEHDQHWFEGNGLVPDEASRLYIKQINVGLPSIRSNTTGISLVMHGANESRYNIVTPLIGWTHT